MRSILVTRPQPVADEFAEKLRREGYAAYVAPMMEYVGVAADLTDLSSYQALIFTSAQAVQVFSGLSAERNWPVLAVGDATAAAAVKSGFMHVHSAKGNSQDVAALIRVASPQLNLKKILHLCSADTSDDIGTAVAKTGVEVVRRTIYKAQLVDGIPEDVMSALQRGAIDTVMLFSARTAKNFTRLMVGKGLRSACSKLEVICISDAVAVPLRELPWRAIRIAHQPRLEAVMQVLREQEQNRRHKSDRRRKKASRDKRGSVDSEAYTGEERRRAARRTQDARQSKRIRYEKIKFLNRSVLTFSFVFIAIVLAGVFLMAPEYAQIKHDPVPEPPVNSYTQIGKHGSPSVGAMLNRFIERLHGSADPVADVVAGVASSAADMVVNPGSADFSQVLSNVASMRQQPDGNAAVSQALGRLNALLSSPDVRSPEDVDRVVKKARGNDSTLDSLFGSVKGTDVGAAAMLLALNEFRSDVSSNRPYADDLALLRKLSGDNPLMNRALQRLAPYAESGVMNRQTLQAELKGLAGDIVSAQVQGQDVSVRDAARKRLQRLSLASTADDTKGASPDAVVARAQVLLDKGDVKGAMRELQRLDGPSAEAARPWLNNAANYVIADQSSDELTQGVLQGVSGVGGASIDGLIGMLKESISGASVPYISSPTSKEGGSSVVAPARPSLPGAP